MLAACMLLFAAPLQDVETVREVLESGVAVERDVIRGAGGELLTDGKYLEWWPNGERKVEGRCREGLRHGKWREWHAGGERAVSGHYKYGLRDRGWTVWEPDGSVVESESGEFAVLELKDRAKGLRARGEARDGTRHGEWTSFWPNGLEQVRCTYREGRLEGPLVFFHAEGTPDPTWISGLYAAGARSGSLQPELVPDPQPTPVFRGEIATLLEQLRSEPAEADTVTQRLFELALDDEQLPAVLVQLDLERPAEAQLATVILRERVLPLWRASFSWAEGPAPGGAPLALDTFEASPLATLRWASLLMITEADFRLLELPLQRRARDPQGPPLRLEALHPLPPELRFERNVFDSVYAARLERRRGDRAEVVEDGLDWLVRHQQENGSWDCDGFMSRCRGEPRCEGSGDAGDVGVTGLALLALLGDGHTPVHGTHREAVARGLTWLVGRQNEAGYIWTSPEAYGRVYEHGVATLALAEAASFTQSEVLHPTLQQAVDAIQRARNPYSAWRYDIPGEGNNDTSVTAWMVLALCRAEAAGLEVNREALLGALAWFDEVSDPATGRCGYDTPGGKSSRVERVNDHYPPEKGEAMTAAALLCRAFLGQNPSEHAVMAKHARLMLQTLPEWDPDGFGCDLYYWYYGSQAMHQMGGTYWSKWSKSMSKALEGSQRKDGDAAGSWDPAGPWGYSGGRVYSTAMALMALQADYRYARLDTMEPGG